MVQVTTPVAVLFEILGHMFRDENVTRVTAVHHPLRDVDARAGDVGATTHVHHATDWSAMNSHPQLELRMFLHRAANLQRTLHRRFRSVVKNQRHAVSTGHSNEATVCLRRAEVVRAAHDLIEQLERAPLLVRHELGIANDVDEEHIGDLQLDLFFNFVSHLFARTVRKSWSYIKRGGRRAEAKDVIRYIVTSLDRYI